MSRSIPYLSIVMAVRNDNYGGDFNRRLQLSVRWLAYLAGKHRLPAELVLVNYNPLPDRPGLETSLDWPAEKRFLKIRMITVPESVHRQFIRPNIRKTVPLFEFIAKNIGIRRARGRFILCTNADILFAEDLIAFFARQQLRPGLVYRSDRYDFRWKKKDRVESEGALEKLEALIQKRVFKFFMQGGIFTLSFPLSLSFRLKMLCRYNAFRKWYYRLLLNTPGDRFFLLLPKLKPDQFFLFHYHCNAGGDMTLMDRESWHKMQGYPEDTWISAHTDSLLLMATVATGIPMEVLPYPVYHQHHRRRFDLRDRNPDMDRMYQRLLREANFMIQSKSPIIHPDANWGSGDLVLEERHI